MRRRTFLEMAAALPLTTLAGAETTPGKRYRAAVIGDTKHGGYGHSLHMLWGLRDDVDVVALSDPDEQGRARHAQECRAQKTYANYREMLEAEQPDLVAVGPRWTINHEAYLKACAEIGAHGILEKPLTPDQAGADRALAALEAKNLKWAIAFNFRASPVMAHLKQSLAEGVIGELLEVRGRGKEDRRAGGEDLIVLGIHLFDILIYLLGEPKWCEATVRDDGHLSTPDDVREATEPLGPIIGDNLNATYEFPGGLPVYFSSKHNRDGNGGRWGLDFYGSKGIITLRMGPVPRLRLLRDPSWAPGVDGPGWALLPGAPEVNLADGRVGHYKFIVDDLMDAIVEDRRPAVSVQDARAAHEMIQGVWASHVNGARVSLPVKQREHPLENWTA
jgi:predicted dehydrogenase